MEKNKLKIKLENQIKSWFKNDTSRKEMDDVPNSCKT